MAALLHAVKSQGLATRMIIFASPVAIVLLIFLAYLAASPTTNPAELAIGDADLLTSIVGGKATTRVIIESDGLDEPEGLRVEVQPISVLKLRGPSADADSGSPSTSRGKRSDGSRQGEISRAVGGGESSRSKAGWSSSLGGGSESISAILRPQIKKAAAESKQLSRQVSGEGSALRLSGGKITAESAEGARGEGQTVESEGQTAASGKGDGENAEADAEEEAEEEAEEVDDDQRGLPAEVLAKERKLARSRKSSSRSSRKVAKVTAGNEEDEIGEDDDEEEKEEADMSQGDSEKGSESTSANKASEEEDVFRELKLSPEDEAMFRELRRTRAEREKAASRVKHKYRKVAFMFLTKGPIPHAKLWERYFKGHEGSYSIYVHTTPGYVFPKNASALFRNNTIRSEAVSWGSPTMIDAERRLIAAALKDPANHNFVLISESCIPVKSFRFAWRYLLGTDYSFVSSFTTNTYVCTGRHDERMAPLIPLEKWRKASQWFSVTRKHASMIIDDVDVHKLFQIYCRGDIQHHECYSDEHYIPTLLNLKDPEHMANRTITYVDFPLNSPHPRTFDPFLTRPSLIRYITKPRMYMHRNVVEPDDETPQSSYTLPCSKDGENRTCFLFARKFDPSALPQLLDLPTKILGY
ncbi:hypothetical protein CLOM_g21474 [Closterium sp. NIES-68]|nr:hypothetical protein CLOM_g21474 [Closterium sp. NIES-68]